MLLAARSVGLVSYNGGILFPERDDLVLITLVSDSVPQDEEQCLLWQRTTAATPLHATMHTGKGGGGERCE